MSELTPFDGALESFTSHRISDQIVELFQDELVMYSDEILFEVCPVPMPVPGPNGTQGVMIGAGVGLYIKVPIVGQESWFFAYSQHLDLMTLKNVETVHQVVMNGVMQLRKQKADFLAGK